MSVIRRLLVVLLFVAAPAAPARAQESGKFALGASFGARIAADSSAVQGFKGGDLLWRFGHGKEGWHWSYGLGWYSADADWLLGSQNTALGELKVRPFMGGYGYSHLVGRYTISGDLLGGFAWAGISQHPQFASAYHSQTGFEATDVDASNTFAVRPGVSVWYDVNKKIGINAAANYTLARPNITVTGPAGVDVRRLRADMFTIRIGAVYSIF